MDEAKTSRIIFMGTPEFAAIILQKLIDWPQANIVGVFTQPDKIAGRGKKDLKIDKTKVLALTYDLPIYQPASLKDSVVIENIRHLQPDFIIVAAYGKIIPSSILEIPHFTSLNVHASLLPAYRGAAPVQWAIAQNWGPQAVTGVSIMDIVPELDAGPVYATASTPIGTHTTESLTRILANMGGELLIQVMKKIIKHQISPIPQDPSLVTYAPKFTKEQGKINWHEQTVEQIDAQVRAVYPWPGAQTKILNTTSQIEYEVLLAPGIINKNTYVNAEPGLILKDKDGLKIVCSNGTYQLTKIKPKGKNWIYGIDFAHGYIKGEGNFKVE